MAGHGGARPLPTPSAGSRSPTAGCGSSWAGPSSSAVARAELSFSIVGADGRPVREFETEHEKRMHVIVVRRDGQGFQHVHPALGEDGVWRVPADPP